MPRLTGAAVAKKMIWLRERIDGHEAGRRGIAEIVAEPGRLEDVTNELVQGLIDAPPLAVRAVKRLVDGAFDTELEAGMDLEATAQLEMFASADFAEAIGAFLERRPARWQGR